jgi:hypothetical protein
MLFRAIFVEIFKRCSIQAVFSFPSVLRMLVFFKLFPSTWSKIGEEGWLQMCSQPISRCVCV